MTLSIAMTTFNGSAYLFGQLDSLLNQTSPADEVVICDDCSQDDSALIVRRFIKEHDLTGWRLYVNEERLGYRANFRKAVSLTSGDLTALCDQDDRWHADKLQTVRALFEANPDMRVLASDFNLIDRDGRPVRAEFPPGSAGGGMIPFAIEPDALVRLPSLQKDPLLLAGCNRALGCCMVMNRAVRQSYLDYVCGGIPHDWEINLIAAAWDGLFFLNRPLIDYRLHGSNTIGLPYGERASVRRVPSEEGRLRVHAEYCAAVRFLTDYLKREALPPLPESLSRYGETRMRALSQSSLSAWLCVSVRFRGIYRRLFTRRQRAGDLAVILMNKLRKRTPMKDRKG